MKKFVAFSFSVFFWLLSFGQSDRWQQRVSYTIEVEMNVETNRFAGKEKIIYFNNSPDTLSKIFFHTYWNAFQPGSNMDMNSLQHGGKTIISDKDGKEVKDWDSRIKDRISNLKPEEAGFQKVNYILWNGKQQKLKSHETILEVILDKPMLPKSSSTFEVGFEAQVPLQIRRSGRDNKEGIKYSMSQWYPKLAEYDYRGWNINTYVGREFYGVWGDYDVKITIDSSYLVAATGVKKEPIQSHVKSPVLTAQKTWNFVGKNIHDFVWAADTQYVDLSKKIRNDLTLHVYYKAKDASTDSAWKNVLWAAEKVLPFIESKFGKYPWPQYSFIQGGDGAMEYAMAALVKGPGLGTAFHEWMHSWYQHMLGSNEYLYPWMDEGFTVFSQSEAMDYYLNTWANQSPYISEVAKEANTKKQLENSKLLPLIFFDSYKSYYKLVSSGLAEPLSTPSDFYTTNYCYTGNSYAKGAVFLSQLGYIVGEKKRDKILMSYYHQWRFKHPNPNDFLQVAERTSGCKLDWYQDLWMNTTKTIDYSVDSLWEEGGKTKIRIRRIGELPMPLDLQLLFKDGSKELHYVPLDLMFHEKAVEDTSIKRLVYKACKWTTPTIVIESDNKLFNISEVEIDPTRRMADVDRRNNILKIKW